MKTFAHLRASSGGRPYFVLLHTREPPDEAAWLAYVAALGAAVRSTSRSIPLMVVSDGGAPNAMQRREYAAGCEGALMPPYAHVFSDDTFVRGVVTAFRWLARNPIAAHSPSAFAEVCASLSLPAEQVLYDLTTLQKTLPTVLCLRLVVGSLHPARASSPEL